MVGHCHYLKTYQNHYSSTRIAFAIQKWNMKVNGVFCINKIFKITINIFHILYTNGD